MKASIYNSILHIANQHTLIFNSFTNNFVVLKNKILKDVSTVASESNSTLFNQLCEGGMLINDKTKELDLLKDLIREITTDASDYTLHINPTLDCNFRCWYCYENHIPNSCMDNETLNATLKFISSVINKPEIKHLELGFFGGEPLMFFDKIARKIISHANKECQKAEKAFDVHFTSNGGLLNKAIIEFLSQFKCGFQITLDGGKASHDKTRYFRNNMGSYDIIIRNIHSLIEKGIDVIARVNYTQDNIDTVASIFGSFDETLPQNRKHLKFDFQRVWQDRHNGQDATELKIRNIRRMFREEGFSVLSNYIPHDVRNSCYGDKINHALINYNGNVYGCTARDFTKENRIGHLTSDGQIEFIPGVMELRNSAKLSKEICKNCRIAPLCGGGCKQRAMEDRTSAECTFRYTEEQKDNIILDIFEHAYTSNTDLL